jgi:hypothetical protein
MAILQHLLELHSSIISCALCFAALGVELISVRLCVVANNDGQLYGGVAIIHFNFLNHFVKEVVLCASIYL